MTVAELEHIRENFNQSPRGDECRFVKLCEKKAAKIYSNKKLRDFAYRQQKLAAENMLAPDVYSKFEYTEDGTKHYVYVTEIVKTIECSHGQNGYGYNWTNFTAKQQNEVEQLKDQLLKIGINFQTVDDIFELNVGWKNGNMVCIDFGRMG